MAKRKTAGANTTVEQSAPAREPLAKSGPTEEQIRQRAYTIYLSRRGLPGSPESDWLQAEMELRQNGQALTRGVSAPGRDHSSPR